MHMSLWTAFHFLCGLLALGVSARLGLHYEPDDYALRRAHSQHNTTDPSSNLKLVKRNPDPNNPLSAIKAYRWMDTSTFVGVLYEPQGSKWGPETIRNAANWFWRDIPPEEDTTIVAALHIPGYGIFFGSVPHTLRKKGEKSKSGQKVFAEKCPELAPRLWHEIKDRVPINRAKNKKNPTLYHAEDVAALVYEANLANHPQFPHRFCTNQFYPDTSFVTAYGEAKKGEGSGWIRACGSDPNHPRVSIKPACTATMQALHIIVDGVVSPQAVGPSSDQDAEGETDSEADADGDTDPEYADNGGGSSHAGPSNTGRSVILEVMNADEENGESLVSMFNPEDSG